MATLKQLIECEISDFFSGFGHPGEPETPEEMQSQLLARVMPLFAGLEQEPVALRYRNIKSDKWCYTSETTIDSNLTNLVQEPLYAAPQLPQPAVVVPSIKPDWMNNEFNAGWNACRSAMLQGVEPVSQPYTLRDGWVAVPVEPTESMVIAGFEAELREEFRDPEAWEAFEAMSGCEQAAHRAKLSWAAMIKAAPQQEASNRIQEERVKIQEEMAMGARLTKHRFKP